MDDIWNDGKSQRTPATSDEYEYLDGMTGQSGDLASMAHWCGEINDGLTRMMDALDGPDATDSFDASCNTCAHFRREAFDRKERLVSIWGFPGTCAKTGDKVTGWPRGIFMGHACYENRRTGSPRSSAGVGGSLTAHFNKPS